MSSPDAISLELQVVIEQGGNAFSVCTGRGKELKGKCRIPKQRCVGGEGDLYIKLVKTVAAGRALSLDSAGRGPTLRAGEPRRAGQTQLLITAPALIHLSRRQFGRWTLFTAEAV